MNSKQVSVSNIFFLRSTIEELDNQGATELANILRNALDRIKELQSGEKLDVIAVRV